MMEINDNKGEAELAPRVHTRIEMKTIYHIAYRKDWNRALVDGVYRADSLESQGFIHMSREDQVNKVANSIFKDEKDLLLLYIDYEKVKDRVRWEGKQDYGEDFPHLYGPLPLDAVVKVVEFKPDRNGNFTKPMRARNLLWKTSD